MLASRCRAAALPLAARPLNTKSLGSISSAARAPRRRAPMPAAAAAQGDSHTQQLAAATAVLAALPSLPAHAEAAVQQAADTFGGADALAAAAAEADPTELVFSVLFTIAIGALVLVTLGVAYLSYTSWNDSRIEAEDRRRVENFRPSARPAAASKKAAAKQEEAVKAPEEFKGFGKK